MVRPCGHERLGTNETQGSAERAWVDSAVAMWSCTVLGYLLCAVPSRPLWAPLVPAMKQKTCSSASCPLATHLFPSNLSRNQSHPVTRLWRWVQGSVGFRCWLPPLSLSSRALIRAGLDQARECITLCLHCLLEVCVLGRLFCRITYNVLQMFKRSHSSTGNWKSLNWKTKEKRILPGLSISFCTSSKLHC